MSRGGVLEAWREYLTDLFQDSSFIIGRIHLFRFHGVTVQEYPHPRLRLEFSYKGSENMKQDAKYNFINTPDSIIDNQFSLDQQKIFSIFSSSGAFRWKCRIGGDDFIIVGILGARFQRSTNTYPPAIERKGEQRDA
jgi:hypothetical protein